MPSLGVAAGICVVAFALAIPLMAFLMMINKMQLQSRYTGAEGVYGSPRASPS